MEQEHQKVQEQKDQVCLDENASCDAVTSSFGWREYFTAQFDLICSTVHWQHETVPK